MRAQRPVFMRFGNERGVALVTTMLLMMLMAALMIGFSAVVTSDQNYRYVDRDRVKAFYGAQSGIEKLNSDLSNLFLVNVAPTAAQITALGGTTNQPVIPDITFASSGSGAAYQIAAEGGVAWNTVTTGPYEGLMAQTQPYVLDATARTAGGGEVHLQRRVQTVAIPVFQFGMFSEVDLSFHAGPNFNFGGRVHTNANLYLAQGGAAGNAVTFPNPVTALGEVVRKYLVNGNPITLGWTSIVQIATAPGSMPRPLADTEGSVVGNAGAGQVLNDPTWTNVSLSDYNGYIKNGRTGARRLNLPIVTIGGPSAIINRPVVNENVTNPVLLGQRNFSQSSLRILLSDLANDITSLPGVTAAPPVPLDGDWAAAPPNNGTAYGPVAVARPPIARSRGIATFNSWDNGGAAGTTVNAGTNRTIDVNGVAGVIPAFFQIPAITVTNGAIVYTVTCTGKNAFAFTGCVPAPMPGATVNAGVAVSANVNGMAVSTNTTANWAAPFNTLAVTSTLEFSHNSFWQAGTNNLVTCSGYDTAPAMDRFTGCTVPANLVQGTQLTTAALSQADIGTIGGFIKIERQTPAGAWVDVTMEILNYGIGGPNLSGGVACGDPTPNAIIRLQRLRDNAEDAATMLPGGVGPCSYSQTTKSIDYWPNVLFDPREALQRDTAPATLRLGGLMHYIALDVRNLSQWFQGAGVYAAGTGANSLAVQGFSVYFSDRRNNRTLANLETGEWGYEDIINPADADGAPSGALNTGEDVNGNNALETYGQNTSYLGVTNATVPGAPATFNDPTQIRPRTAISASQAKVNRALLFRRALKLINGGLGNIVAPGLTITSENPVYVQGDWNANQATGFGVGPNFNNGGVATSIVADSVTLLSNAWDDNISFSQPYSPGNRPRSAQSWYRFAVMAGKNMPFPFAGVNNPGANDFGTDGGAHNFLRMLESGGTVNYRGSIATLFFARQAVGVYKCCNTVYGAPTRNFNFDTNFLNPALLPPLTPLFRDLNALGFSQETRPGM